MEWRRVRGEFYFALLRSILMVLLTLGGLVACAEGPQTRRTFPATVIVQAQPTSVSVTTGAMVTLRVGEEVRLDGDTARLRLDSIIEDSRCPANARCIWQGRVVVTASLTSNTAAYPFTLGTLGGMDDAPRTAQADRYHLRIEAVEPYPDHADQLSQADYLVSFWIEQGAP